MRHRRRMHGLGALTKGCEIHVFKDGSRKKACPKRKVSAKAKSAWMRNLKSACSKKGAPSKACKKVK